MKILEAKNKMEKQTKEERIKEAREEFLEKKHKLGKEQDIIREKYLKKLIKIEEDYNNKVENEIKSIKERHRKKIEGMNKELVKKLHLVKEEYLKKIDKKRRRNE